MVPTGSVLLCRCAHSCKLRGLRCFSRGPVGQTTSIAPLLVAVPAPVGRGGRRPRARQQLDPPPRAPPQAPGPSRRCPGIPRLPPSVWWAWPALRALSTPTLAWGSKGHHQSHSQPSSILIIASLLHICTSPKGPMTWREGPTGPSFPACSQFFPRWPGTPVGCQEKPGPLPCHIIHRKW